MKVYILTIAAGRQDEEAVDTAAKTSLTIQPSKQAAHDEAIRIAEESYSSAMGWKGYAIDIVELPQELDTDGYRMTWKIEPLSTSEGE